jgi:hypothetical protein
MLCWDTLRDASTGDCGLCNIAHMRYRTFHTTRKSCQKRRARRPGNRIWKISKVSFRKIWTQMDAQLIAKPNLRRISQFNLPHLVFIYTADSV